MFSRSPAADTGSGGDGFERVVGAGGGRALLGNDGRVDNRLTTLARGVQYVRGQLRTEFPGAGFEAMCRGSGRWGAEVRWHSALVRGIRLR